MNKINKEIIKTIIDTCHPDIIYQVGSSVSLDHPNDIDILVLYRKQEDFLKFKRFSFKIGALNCEVFGNSFEGQMNNVVNYAYGACSYLKPLYGSLNSEELKSIDFLQNKELKTRLLIRLVGRYMCHKYGNLNGSSYMCKPYRFLMTIYFIDNNSYDLTSDQIAILNKVHDEKMMSQDLWKYCESVLMREIQKQ